MRSIFVRTRYTGVTRYTHLRTGGQCSRPETMVIVQNFISAADAAAASEDGSYAMTASYKAAYLSENNVAYMKLHFAQAPAATAAEWPGPVNPIVLQSTVSFDRTPQIGALDAPYPGEVSGTFEIFGPRPWRNFVAWRYARYFGAQITPIFDDAESNAEISRGLAFYIDGRGHRCDGRFTRMMVYSVEPHDAQPLHPVFMKTSELAQVERVVSDVGFELFHE